jgi:hypothetical protein
MRSSLAILAALSEGLRAAGLPDASIQLVPTRDRSAVGLLLAGLDGNIDVIVPRGGKSLVARVQAEARVPVFAHLEGVCHIFVHRAASLGMAKKIVLNAKMRRTGVCGAAETLLVDRGCAATHLKPLTEMLIEAGCEIHGDTATLAVDKRVKPATEEDWATEYLDAIIAVKVVDDIFAAIEHIERFGSHHTDAIVTDDKTAAEKFLREVDSAIVPHNASTQFADGGEFGFGAEIGIATGRLHARVPVGVDQLTTFQVPHPRKRSDPAVNSKKPAIAERLLPPHAPVMRIGLFEVLSTRLTRRTSEQPCLRSSDSSSIASAPGDPWQSAQNTSDLAPLPKRIAAARRSRIIRIDVTGLKLSLRRDTLTIRYLGCWRCPGVRLSGSWARITCGVSIAGRNGATLRSWCLSSSSTGWAQAFTLPPVRGNVLARARIPEPTAAAALPDRKAPVWAFLHGLKSPLSRLRCAPCAGARNPGGAAQELADPEMRRRNVEGSHRSARCQQRPAGVVRSGQDNYLCRDPRLGPG